MGRSATAKKKGSMFAVHQEMYIAHIISLNCALNLVGRNNRSFYILFGDVCFRQRAAPRCSFTEFFHYLKPRLLQLKGRVKVMF